MIRIRGRARNRSSSPERRPRRLALRSEQAESSEARGNVGSEVDVKRTPAPRTEHLEISDRLKPFHLAEGVPMAGNREVLRVL